MLLSKITVSKTTFKTFFHKNIANNDDYINKYCFPNQTEFTDKCIMWYSYKKTKDVREYNELWLIVFR